MQSSCTCNFFIAIIIITIIIIIMAYRCMSVVIRHISCHPPQLLVTKLNETKCEGLL